MLAIGNALANSVWEAQTHNRTKPTPSSSREEKVSYEMLNKLVEDLFLVSHFVTFFICYKFWTSNAKVDNNQSLLFIEWALFYDKIKVLKVSFVDLDDFFIIWSSRLIVTYLLL